MVFLNIRRNPAWSKNRWDDNNTVSLLSNLSREVAASQRWWQICVSIVTQFASSLWGPVAHGIWNAAWDCGCSLEIQRLPAHSADQGAVLTRPRSWIQSSLGLHACPISQPASAFVAARRTGQEQLWTNSVNPSPLLENQRMHMPHSLLCM